MRLLGLEITRAANPRLAARVPANTARVPVRRGGIGLFGLIRESFTGAWQSNQEIAVDSVASYFAVYACVSLIATDIAKLGLRLVAQDSAGIWTPTEANAFTPVLRKPNRYQTRIKFIEHWLTSKLLQGNTYVLKERSGRETPRALYVLDPSRVTPLVAPDGSVFYELKRDDLSGVPDSTVRPGGVVVPASEIIHDSMITLFHPLCGVTPIYACGLAAKQGLQIQATSENFFANGARPSGILTAPEEIGDDQAAQFKADWNVQFSGPNAGSIAVLAGGLKYEPLAMTAVDAQLIDQLQWSAKMVCACYHVPAHFINVGDGPTASNSETVWLQYYSQCLQQLIENLELCLDEGLELPKPYGTEFDLDDLLRMDSTTRAKVAADGVGAGVLSPNDARRRYFNLGAVTGGDTPYLQQQNYSLEALAKRDSLDDPFSNRSVSASNEVAELERLFSLTHTKAIAEGLYES